MFFLAFLLHVVIWKVRIPKRQTKALLRILFGTLGIGLLSLWYAPFLFEVLGFSVPTGLFEYLHIFLLTTSLSLAYITTYSGMEVDSPSLVMTKLVAEAGVEGISKEDFIKSLSDDILLKPRVQDLLRDNLACFEDGKLRVTPKGARVARIFLLYRKLLNVTAKGG